MSTLKVNSIEPANAGSEDYFLARAWVTFNSSGTVSINADGNVSSITDNGTGDYTTNFSSNLTDGNYTIAGNAQRATTLELLKVDVFAASRGYTAFLSSSCRHMCRFSHSGSVDDSPRYSIGFIR